MQTLIFATNNKNKVEEINSILNGIIEIKTMSQAGIEADIPEPHDTLEANATEKSSYIFNLLGKDCFSEDTGLEVVALNGEPGVRSARYAGDDSDSGKNIEKLLKNLENIDNREAQFRTVISLFFKGKEYLFEGVCRGNITASRRGTKGFGYDPVFIPAGSSKSFAEMNMEEKNQYSHRKKATAQLIEFLKKSYGQN
jgi:XTP/dITP diphosphohydrolase